MFDLPFDTHCWIVEELSGGKHLLQMIFSRFVQYLKVLKNNKRLFIRNLFDIVSGDAQSPTGSNVKQIIRKTGLDPRYAAQHKYSNWRVYPPADDQTVPLLTSLLEIRSENWQVNFDTEEEMESFEDRDIDFMIVAVCTGQRWDWDWGLQDVLTKDVTYSFIYIVLNIYILIINLSWIFLTILNFEELSFF